MMTIALLSSYMSLLHMFHTCFAEEYHVMFVPVAAESSESQYIGALAITFVTFSFGGIILLDVVTLGNAFKSMWIMQHIKQIICPSQE